MNNKKRIDNIENVLKDMAMKIERVKTEKGNMEVMAFLAAFSASLSRLEGKIHDLSFQVNVIASFDTEHSLIEIRDTVREISLKQQMRAKK